MVLNKVFNRQVEDEIREYFDDLNGNQIEDFPEKDRGKAETRRNRNENAKVRHKAILVSKGYDPEYSQVAYGYKLSELGHTNPWKKYNTSPKKVRQNPDLDGKGGVYKRF